MDKELKMIIGMAVLVITIVALGTIHAVYLPQQNQPSGCDEIESPWEISWEEYKETNNGIICKGEYLSVTNNLMTTYEFIEVNK